MYSILKQFGYVLVKLLEQILWPNSEKKNEYKCKTIIYSKIVYTREWLDKHNLQQPWNVLEKQIHCCFNSLYI